MIPVSNDLLALLQSDQVTCVDLWTITPPGLSPITLTSADLDVTVSGVVYRASGVRIERGTTKLVVGTDTDTLDLTLYPDTDAELQINGIPLREATARGMLSGAAVTLQWAYLSAWGPPPVVVATLLRWQGTFGQVVGGKLKVDITCNNPFYRMDQQVPTRVFGAPCWWTLGDAGCGVNLSAYAHDLTISANSTNKLVQITLPSLPQGWSGGKMVFNSGSNEGVRRTIQSYVAGVATLATPLPWAPQAGDAVTVYPGCDKVAPVYSAKTISATIPASKTLTYADWAKDAGVIASINQTIQISDGVYEVVASSLTMVAVASNPSTGQYSVSAGTYSFAAADVGEQIQLTYYSLVSGGTSCAYFGNLNNFGGQPYIPAPESAYTTT